MGDQPKDHRITIDKVEGDVIISQNQTGGITAHQAANRPVLSASSTSKSRRTIYWIIMVIGTLAAIAIVLTYFAITPFQEESRSNIQAEENKPLAEDTTGSATGSDNMTDRISHGKKARPNAKSKENKPMAKGDEKISVGNVSGDAVTSINQSGGITTHTVHITDPPRTMTEPQRQT